MRGVQSELAVSVNIFGFGCPSDLSVEQAKEKCRKDLFSISSALKQAFIPTKDKTK